MSMAVETLRRVLASEADYSVAWIARNGAESVEKCAKDTPDLILMDLVMPVLDGVEATRRIMARTPCPILVVGAGVGGESTNVIEALSAGAVDAVQTPELTQSGRLAGGEKLKLKIETIRRLIVESNGRRLPG